MFLKKKNKIDKVLKKIGVNSIFLKKWINLYFLNYNGSLEIIEILNFNFKE